MNDDVKWMKKALRLAEKGLGTTSPNPMVGAVIVKDRGRTCGSQRDPRRGRRKLERRNDLCHSGTLFVLGTYAAVHGCDHQGGDRQSRDRMP